MSFRVERDLAPRVAGWLRSQGFAVAAEVPILTRRADLVGLRDDCVAAIEMKLSAWPKALREGIAYQVAADRVWVAMPLARAAAAYGQRWRFESEGIGLLAVDERGGVRSAVRAEPSPRLLPFAQAALRRACRPPGPAPHSPLSTHATGLEAF